MSIHSNYGDLPGIDYFPYHLQPEEDLQIIEILPGLIDTMTSLQEEMLDGELQQEILNSSEGNFNPELSQETVTTFESTLNKTNQSGKDEIKKILWTKEQDDQLLAAITSKGLTLTKRYSPTGKKISSEDWKKIATEITDKEGLPCKSAQQCKSRLTLILKTKTNQNKDKLTTDEKEFICNEINSGNYSYTKIANNLNAEKATNRSVFKVKNFVAGYVSRCTEGVNSSLKDFAKNHEFYLMKKGPNNEKSKLSHREKLQ